ncbi:MAG: cation transporter [Micrococcus sp.]|nr:cation transporter [Micrococcus sp.]
MPRTEQQILRVSLYAILAFSALGITFGLITGSQAIIFDGVFSLWDAVVSIISILVAGLIARTGAEQLSPRMQRRFTFGFWHLEPLVIAVSSLFMLAVAVYALVQSVSSLLSGGRDVSYGPALVYAVLVLSLSVSVALVERRANRSVQSALVALDVKGWFMGAAITGALLVAFIVALILEGTEHAWLVPYVDPAVLALVAVALLPVPIGPLREALGHILLVTPTDLHERAEALAEQIVRDEGFTGHRITAARVGRQDLVEVEFRVPRGAQSRPLEEWDAIRERVMNEFDGDHPDQWITVYFTTRYETQPAGVETE